MRGNKLYVHVEEAVFHVVKIKIIKFIVTLFDAHILRRRNKLIKL